MRRCDTIGKHRDSVRVYVWYESNTGDGAGFGVLCWDCRRSINGKLCGRGQPPDRITPYDIIIDSYTFLHTRFIPRLAYTLFKRLQHKWRRVLSVWTRWTLIPPSILCPFRATIRFIGNVYKAIFLRQGKRRLVRAAVDHWTYGSSATMTRTKNTICFTGMSNTR